MRWIDKYIPPPPLMKGNKIEYEIKILLEITKPYIWDPYMINTAKLSDIKVKHIGYWEASSVVSISQTLFSNQKVIGQLKYIFLWRTRHGFLMNLITTWGCKSKGKDPEQNKSKERTYIFFWLKVGFLCGSKKQEQMTEGLLSMLKKIWSSIWQAC